MSTEAPDFAHIVAMTEEYGTFEHADHAVPRREHGFCTDDVARVLLVAAREPDPTDAVRELASRSLRFINDAQGRLGDCRNRRDVEGRWRDAPSVQDCWGRSLWGLGVAAASGDVELATQARALFERGAMQRSPWSRAMVFASLGAIAVLSADPTNDSARALLGDAVDVIGSRRVSATWPWPDDRLTYANAAVPEVLIGIGTLLDRPDLLDDGLELLGWLLDRETYRGHLSVTPVGGAGPGDPPGRFDQQPIEVAAMVDACVSAFSATKDQRWADGIRMGAAWFDGDNDTGAVMWDPASGGGFDGLEVDGANLNQGAESTLALLSTRQQARALESMTP